MDMLVTCLNVAGDSATAIVVSNSEGCLIRHIYELKYYIKKSMHVIMHRFFFI